MTVENFSDAMGQLRDPYIEEAARYWHRGVKSRWVRLGVVAACLCILAAGGALLAARGPAAWPARQTSEQVITLTQVDIGDRTACYYQVSAAERRLNRELGTLYRRSDDVAWYTLAGKDNLKYLIRCAEDGGLTLWCFQNFVVSEGETYTYGDVLTIIYGVDSAQEIASITTTASRGNNTDFGKRIQREVGTHTYTATGDLAAFYQIVVDVECLGEGSRLPGDDRRFTYSFSTDAQDKLTSGESTYATRVITVTLTDGTTIDSWKYNALSGSFFEYGGIFTTPLPEEAVYTLNRIFGIS